MDDLVGISSAKFWTLGWMMIGLNWLGWVLELDSIKDNLGWGYQCLTIMEFMVWAEVAEAIPIVEFSCTCWLQKVSVKDLVSSHLK